MAAERICIIGGGGRLWAIQFLKDLAYNRETGGTVVLYDIDKEAAQRNVAVGERIMAVNNAGSRFTITAEDDLGAALDGCDLVIISIEPGSTQCRRGDLMLPEEYGILQSVGDTTGPGGIMRARRAIPLFVKFGAAIAAHCPDAWVINYTNPMTLCTAALHEGFASIKALGCCHEVFHTQNFLAERVARWFGVQTPDRRTITIDLTGINHFTFVTAATWEGHDLMARLKAELSDPHLFDDQSGVAAVRLQKEQWFDCDQLIALSFLRDFGTLGAAGDRHLAEFVPWFLQSDEDLHTYGVIRTPYRWRERQAEEKRARVFEDKDLVAERSDEEGVDIMQALAGGPALTTNINRPNEGQVSYLPKGRIVESNGLITQDSIRPIMAGDPPLAIQNLVRHASDVQQMTLEAVLADDDERLFGAFLSDPLMTIARNRARELFDRMLAECRLQY
ncbi:MAG: alpha-galactosidase [Sphaerochaeta sp.]|jgi:alpha-galactosidase|nr:alpha-galactosidase [Sphaerochaeta sp.]